MHRRLHSFLYYTIFISASQHGFIQGKSTVSGILKIINNVHKEMDNAKCVCIIACDFTDALDTVERSILLNKLLSSEGRGVC